MTQTLETAQSHLLEEVFQRVASDLAMVADREVNVGSVAAERVQTRPAGAGCVHISFRVGLKHGAQTSHGCLAVPLPDAIALASFLMMVPDDSIATGRSQTTLDATTKDAMMEVGNFIAGAVEAGVHALGSTDWSAAFEGCQGVRADVRPALVYQEGDPLLVARADVTLGDFEPAPWLLILPEVSLG